MRRPGTFLLVALLPVTACSLVTSFDGLTGGSSVGGDAESTGKTSCMLCAESAAAGSFALQPTNLISLPAGSYRAEAWIRSPVRGPVAGGTGVQVTPVSGSTFQGTMVGPDVDWISSTEPFTLIEPAQVVLQVHTYFPMNGCVLVDDVAIYTQ